MFYLWDMPTHRIKVRKYLKYIENQCLGKANNIAKKFNKKDEQELVRLHHKMNGMNKLFIPE